MNLPVEITQRMTKGSKNYNKQRKKIAKLHLHIANQRLDHAHKRTKDSSNNNLKIKVKTKNRRNCGGCFKRKLNKKPPLQACKAKWGQFTWNYIDANNPNRSIYKKIKEQNLWLEEDGKNIKRELHVKIAQFKKECYNEKTSKCKKNF